MFSCDVNVSLWAVTLRIRHFICCWLCYTWMQCYYCWKADEGTTSACDFIKFGLVAAWKSAYFTSTHFQYIKWIYNGKFCQAVNKAELGLILYILGSVLYWSSENWLAYKPEFAPWNVTYQINKNSASLTKKLIVVPVKV